MSRNARQLSSTGIYHVMLRGINKERIFHDRNDYRHFLNILQDCKELVPVTILAYCLMPNHIHLLIKTEDGSLSSAMKRIGIRYAAWFNAKYHRVGHLFQDRFRSEPVETDQYFKTVVRYILQNPIKAGLEPVIGAYPWSSYQDCVWGDSTIVGVQELMDVFDGCDAFKTFIHVPNDDTLMDVPEYQTEDACIEDLSIQEADDDANPPAATESFSRDTLLKMHNHGLSLRQIQAVTGLSKSTIHRAIRL